MDCRPLGPGIVVLLVLGLSSFGSWDCRPFGAGIVVLLALGLLSFGSWDCRPYGPPDGWLSLC